jgi:hypothetical protein
MVWGSNPSGGRDLPHLAQTGPGAHPVSYTMGTGCFRGVKMPVRGVNHAPASTAEVKQRVEVHIYSSSGPSWSCSSVLLLRWVICWGEAVRGETIGKASYGEVQRCTKFYKDLQRSIKIYKVLQKSTKVYKDLQRCTKIYKDVPSSTKIYKDL